MTKPIFPITGNDLLQKDFKSGKELGDMLKYLYQLWIDSRFKLNSDELIKGIFK